MRRASWAAWTLVLLGCGGGQTHPNLFSPEWEDDEGRSIEAVRQRLGASRPTRGLDVAIGVTGNNEKLVGLPLGPGGKRWVFAHPLDARPVISGAVVVGSGGGEVFALDAATGKKLWARPTGGLPLRGAADDGAVTVMTFARATGRGSTLLAVTRDGASVRQIETDRELGAPAVLAGMAFVPWGDRHVSVVDLSNGNEAGRLSLPEKTTCAFASGGALYFGERTVFRFDASMREASRGLAPSVSLREDALPGSPRWMRPCTERTPPQATTPDRVRVVGRPRGDGPLALDSGRFYGNYHRLAMGFGEKDGRLAWVSLRPHAVLGSAAAEGGLVVCDEQGKLAALSAARGAVAWELDLGEPVKGCAVQVDTTPVAGADGGRPLAVALAEALTSGDVELAGAYELLLRELASTDDAATTRALIALSRDGRMPPSVHAQAKGALAKRTSGAPAMKEALASHFDFVEDRLVGPPVGAIAQALARMGERSAAPLLVAHLLDPATAEAEVQAVAEALEVLAGPAEVPALTQFFALTRASAEGEPLIAAAVSAARVIVASGGAAGRGVVERAARDPMTVAGLRERLPPLLDPKRRPDARPPRGP